MIKKLMTLLIIYVLYTVLFSDLGNLRSGNVSEVLKEQATDYEVAKENYREFIMEDLIPYVDAKVEPFRNEDRSLVEYTYDKFKEE